ncbi:MAG: serine/threonine protein kinase [Rhodothermaceae bacterium]|nr:serine/threonine protein kinase [Rhodothermaceae bacterium]
MSPPRPELPIQEKTPSASPSDDARRMDTQRWHQVKAIFEQVVERPSAERMAYLASACGEDERLREEVESLLAAHDDETPFLSEPVAPMAWGLLEQPEAMQQGMRLGPYRLVRELGHGGMGLVYLAERADGQFEQQVAVKLVRQGHMRSDLVRRFQHERQLLASLSHPGIARLLGGGMTEPVPGAPDGLPYLVMEYVEGEPITAYGDRHRLSVRARIELFRTVCETVQYAHQNLIVHRDLKPSNILVTADGRVKLLDFGIARLIEDPEEDPSTRTGFPAMTPTYAAPEQVRGEPATTATDVYALGVLLYELLTGHRPYDVHGLTPSAVERVICEEVPHRPSTAVARVHEDAAMEEAQMTTPEAVSRARATQPEALRRRLQGDLDTIVMKALRKDPQRRYAFAADLNDDLHRYLTQLPVRARPDTLRYRLSKFVRRHVVGVGASALIGLALLGGIIATTRQARIAERRSDEVRQLAGTLLFDVHDAIRDLPGATQARQTLVTNALAYLDNLYREGPDDPSLQFELAAAYEQIGEIQGNPHYTNLGDLEGALESYRRAFQLRAALWQRDSTEEHIRRALANSYGHLATVIDWRGGEEDVAAMRLRALDLLAPLAARRPAASGILHDVGRIQSEYGWGQIFDGQHNEGLANVEAAIALLESLARADSSDLALALHLWRAYSYRADGLSFSGRSEELLTLMRDQGLPFLHRLEHRHPNHPRVQYGLHIAYGYLGLAQGRLGFRSDEEAPASHRMALTYAEAMVRSDSTNEKGQEALARALNALATVYLNHGRTDEAIASYERALAIAQRRYDEDRANAEAGNRVALIQRRICRAFVGADRLEEALPACEASIAMQEGVVELTNLSVYLGNLGSAYGHTARIHRALARRASAPGERQAHEERALHWYALGVTTLEAVKAQKSADDLANLAWEVHPDSLAAEHAALQGATGR